MSNKQQGCGEWLIAKGRNDPYGINFLWREKSKRIYVMDNHRAAAWCWLQQVDPDRAHSLLHIDQHYDCASSRPEEVSLLSGLKHRTIDEYLALVYEDGPGNPLPVFRWDNYLSVYLAGYRGSIKHLRICTHDRDHKPQYCFDRGDFWNIPQQIDGWLDPKDGPWILNLDLDYFFWWAPPGGRPGLMASDNIWRSRSKRFGKK